MTGALILIVEDNDRNRKLVRDLLQFKGYRTIDAETARGGHPAGAGTPPGADPHGHPAARASTASPRSVSSEPTPALAPSPSSP